MKTTLDPHKVRHPVLLAVRIAKADKKKLEKHCAKRNLTVSQVVRYLIKSRLVMWEKI